MPRTAGRRRVWARVWAAVAGLAVTGVVCSGSSPASAADRSWAASYTTSSPEALLIPGGSTSGTLRLVNRGSAAIAVVVRLVDLADDENGCLPEERQSTLEDCGVGGDQGTGELSSQVRLAVGQAPGAPMSLDTRLAPIEVAPGQRLDVPVRLSLPASSTNETMTDRLSFTLSARAGNELVEVTGGVGGDVDQVAGPSGFAPGLRALSAAWFLAGAGLLALVVSAVRAGRMGSDQSRRRRRRWSPNPG